MTDYLHAHHTTGDDSYLTVYGATYWGYQSFPIPIAHTITKVKMLLYRVGSPGTLSICLKTADGDTKPTGDDLLTGTTDGDTLPTGSPYEWREVTLSNGSSKLSPGIYCLILKALSGDGDNRPCWREDTSDAYPGGTSGYTLDGSTWNIRSSNDFLFQIWGSRTGKIFGFVRAGK